MSEGEIVLYNTEDGLARVQLRAADGTVWLTQAQIAELFATSRPNITQHLTAVFQSGECEETAVCKQDLLTAADGKRYRTTLYRLEAILAVGYRVRSIRGVQFRQWATTRLRDYLVKGFVLDEARLRDPGPFDYFDELLEKIRDIRASEKRFYQKVRDVYATATDYTARSNDAQIFFATVQNKMLHAVTGKTAGELIVARADPGAPNMGLQSWKGGKVRKGDVDTAKNYLHADEVSELNRIVTMFLDFAEDQAGRRKAMTMAEWSERLDAFLTFNDRDVLANAGKVGADDARRIARERFEAFDNERRLADDRAAEIEHVEEMLRLTAARLETP
ncbi:virulence RhuM family protein [Caulobacter sp. ErkDOM-YI]|uniref:virulence RhuM family protein n=1 Tax=unclassified Caulobacter TaxID=2648921 RepID=UPI003AF4DE66